MYKIMGILFIKTQFYLSSYFSGTIISCLIKIKTQALCLNINISILKDMPFYGLITLFPSIYSPLNFYRQAREVIEFNHSR